MTVVTVWSAALVLPVRLQLAPASATSDLELLVLRAVHTGVEDAATLAQYFGLPKRLVIDVVGDLWRAGRVQITLGEAAERLAVTEDGRKMLAVAEAGGVYEMAMRTPHVERVLLDTLSGQLLPYTEGRQQPRDRRLLVPAQDDDADARQIAPELLAEAVGRSLRRRGGSEERVGEQRVVSARLVPAFVSGLPEVRYVSLDVDVAHRADGGLGFRLLESLWAPDVQRRTVERLQRVVDERPSSEFTRALGSSAGERLAEAVTPARLFADLRSSALRLATTPAKSRKRAHDRIEGAFEHLGHLLGDLARREVAVRLVHTKGDHDRAVSTLIEAAQAQLVIALPWLHYDELSKHQAELENAVRRGVGITILWGIDREDKTLEGRVLNLLDDVARAGQAADQGGFLHVDREQSAHIHAKLVAADDRMALVTSRNLFSGSDLFEVGVLVEAAEGARAPLLEDIIRWTYNTTPSLGHASALFRDPSLFGPRYGAEGVARIAPPAWDEVQLTDPDCPPELLDLWQRGWIEALDGLESQLARPAPVGYLVTDGLHRSLLADALREATQRVVVSSRGLNSHVLNGGMIEQVRQCLDRGVPVTFYYATTRTEDDLRALERLRKAAAGARAQLEVVHRGQMHAKLLIFDDEAVVGSFNYLSFDGAYGPGRWSQKAELGIRFVDQELADVLVRLLATTQFRGGHRPLAARADAAPLRPVNVASEVVRILDGVEAVDLAQLARLVNGHELLLAVHRELVISGADLGLTRRLDAALVAAGSESVRAQALSGLLSRSWRLGDAQVAAAVRRFVADPEIRPRESLVSATAALVRDPASADREVLDLLQAEDTGASERWALIVARMLSVLATGDSARANLGIVAGLDSLPELARWHQAALDFVVVHGPLPTGVAELLGDAQEQFEREQWDSIPPLVDRLGRWVPGHLESEQTAQYLYAEPLGELKMIAIARDVDGLVDWVARNKGTTDGGWLDAQVQRAGVRIRIDSDRRRYLLLVTRPLLLTARGLAARARAGDPPTLDDAEVAALRRLGQDSRTLLEVLPAEPDTEFALAGLRRLVSDLGAAR